MDTGMIPGDSVRTAVHDKKQKKCKQKQNGWQGVQFRAHPLAQLRVEPVSYTHLLTDLESIQNYHTGDLLTRWSSDASNISSGVLNLSLIHILKLFR